MSAPARSVLVHAVAGGREALHQNESPQVLVHVVAAGREEVHQDGEVTR